MSPHYSSILVGILTVAGLVAVALFPDHDTVATIALGVIGAVSVAFTCTYLLRSNWRATLSGQIILRLVACLGAIGIHGVINALTDSSYPGRDYIRPALLVIIAAGVLHLLLQLWWMQRDEGMP